MQKLLRRLLPLVALASLVPLVAPAPAHAHDDHCVGAFAATFSEGLGLPVVSGTKFFTFTITMTSGTCDVKGLTFTMSGEMVGTCYNATGDGVTNNEHVFSVVWAGPTMTFTNQVTGTLFGFTSTGSCGSGTATGATMGGVLAKSHVA